MNDVYVRKMASVQKIAEVKSIPEANRICAYRVNGWWIVDQVGKYQAGDLVVYCEIDSWIPNEIAPFLSKGNEPREFNGVKGEKLRTIRLKKQVSQGLLLPLTVCDKIESELFEDLDVSYPLNIQKWEAPPEFTSADAKGSFPSWIIKTNQERIQNCYDDVAQYFEELTWEETEKCEGSSMTVYFRDGEFGVCSKNIDLKESKDNTCWKIAVEFDLKNKMSNLGKNIAIQGELCGPGIQDNIYKLTKHMFFVFDVFDIDKFEYWIPAKRRELTAKFGLTNVPIYHKEKTLIGKSRDELLADATGKSVLGTINCLREGIVYKANSNNRISFKCVSNLYLENKK